MKLRPLLGAVLGLMLTVQGVAVASAPLGMPSPPASTAAVQDAADAMPCHGAAPAPAPDNATAPCACCQDDCPDLAVCASGTLAAAPVIKLTFAPASQPACAPRERAAPSVSLPFRLRPPIPLHA